MCVCARDFVARSKFEFLNLLPSAEHLVEVPARLRWGHGRKQSDRFVAPASRWRTGNDVNSWCKEGKQAFFDHVRGMVEGETAESGDGCTVHQGAMLGACGFEVRPRSCGRNEFSVLATVPGEVRMLNMKRKVLAW